MGSPDASLDIRADDLSGEMTQRLLALHLADMHANSPPGSVFALDLSGLRAPGVSVWSAWRRSEIVGVGALKELGDGTAELKSMRTHPDHLRTGVALALLDHMVAVAETRGLRRLSLETGSGPAFTPAHALYASRGFSEGEPFSDYSANAFSCFFHRDL